MSRAGGADFRAGAVVVNGTHGKGPIRVAGEGLGASVS
jgi:hypothetical protein